jgi:hypothetical protein
MVLSLGCSAEIAVIGTVVNSLIFEIHICTFVIITLILSPSERTIWPRLFITCSVRILVVIVNGRNNGIFMNKA